MSGKVTGHECTGEVTGRENGAECEKSGSCEGRAQNKNHLIIITNMVVYCDTLQRTVLHSAALPLITSSCEMRHQPFVSRVRCFTHISTASQTPRCEAIGRLAHSTRRLEPQRLLDVDNLHCQPNHLACPLPGCRGNKCHSPWCASNESAKH